MNSRGWAQGKQAGSNGNQSAAKCSRRPPPRFPWGRCWEAELWCGCSSRCGLCRAGVGGRRCAWQQGPAWDVAGLRLDARASLWPQVHQLQKVPRIPGALGLAALGAPGYLSAFPRLGPAPGPALSLRGSGPPAEGPASTRSAWTGSLDGAASLLLCPSQRRPRVGSQPLQKVSRRTQ